MRKPLLSELSLREKIGQTAVARPKFVDGPDTFKKYPYGAIWLARGNNDKFDNLGEDQVEDPESDFPKKYDLWLKEANKNMPVPILAAMDAAQGGAKACPGMSFCTTAAGVGATRSEELARELFECIGREAIASGNNWIWSPVADQPSPFCSVMVGRSLTSDLDLCARLLCAEIDGLQSSGVAAAVKHFPGADKNEYRDDMYIYPEYEIIKESGPDHDKSFEAQVKFNGKILAKGAGKSKKGAEMQAAKKALENLK